jgi:DNA-binding beta-propeller fold protein YncE
MRLFPAPALLGMVRQILTGLAIVCVCAGVASAQTYHFSTLAGVPQTGTTDGAAASARFSEPITVAFDGTSIYVSDRSNHTIRRITAGNVTTLAGLAGTSGLVNASGSLARFNRPGGIAVGSDGILYVSDTSNQVIRKVTAAGAVTTLAGAGTSGSANGAGAAAQFSNPNGIAVDADLNVYVADTLNNTIRAITPAGVVTTLAGTAGAAGTADGTGASARFSAPIGLAINAAGTILLVTDFSNHTIRQIVIATGVVTTVAGSAGSSGGADGTGTGASFNQPYGIAIDASDNMYVSEFGTHRLRKIAPGFVVTTLSGLGQNGYANGAPDVTRFNLPAGLAVSADGATVYVADSVNSAIRGVTAAGVSSTISGSNTSGTTDGTGSVARFAIPGGIAVNPTNGLVYTTSPVSHTLRQITGRGVTTTLAGLANTAGSVDGTGSAALFNSPINVGVDITTGNVYVADRANHTVRRVTPAGVVTTLAGVAGNAGTADGTGAAARFNGPAHVEVAPDGMLYVSDSNGATIRQVTPEGVVTTLAGSAGLTGSTDATGAAARFSGASGLAVNETYVYVADGFNHTIRRITRAGGVVTTIAGLAGSGGAIDGTGNVARFQIPIDLALDSAGDLFVADYNNHTIRRVTPAGVVTTIAGLATSRGGTDGAGTAARFFQPAAIAIGKHDTIYVADRTNNAIRMGIKATTDVATNGSFADGTTAWLQFGLPTMAAIVSNVTDGVFQFYRNGTQAVAFQETGLPLPAGAPVQAQFEIGNSDNVRKRISVLFHDSDFADLSVCTFFLPPNAPLQTYTMRSHTTKAWGSATVSFYAATNGTNNGGFYRLDNLSVEYTPANSATETRCVDPLVPAAPGGAAGPDLLTNGGFGSAINTGPGNWNTFGQIQGQVTGGVFEFIKLAGTPAGVLLQATAQPMTANQILTATFQLGNSSNVRKRVTVILHDNNFSDLSACTFWLAPGQPLSTYTYRTYATQAWANATFSVYPATVGAEQWIRFDNATLLRTPGTGIVGTECIEPGGVADALGDAALSALSLPFSVQTTPVETQDADARAPGVTRDGDSTADGFEGSTAGGWQAQATTSGRRVLTLDGPVDLTVATTATLHLDSWLSGVLSRAYIEVSLDGDLWTPLHVVEPSDTWVPLELDLTAWVGTRIQIRFVFDAVAPTGSAAPDSWQVDGVDIAIE